MIGMSFVIIRRLLWRKMRWQVLQDYFENIVNTNLVIAVSVPDVNVYASESNREGDTANIVEKR